MMKIFLNQFFNNLFLITKRNIVRHAITLINLGFYLKRKKADYLKQYELYFLEYYFAAKTC